MSSLAQRISQWIRRRDIRFSTKIRCMLGYGYFFFFHKKRDADGEPSWFGTIYVDVNNFNIQADLRMSGVYDFPLTLQVLENIRSDDTVLNIGANIGYFSVVAATKAALVFAFEPDPINFSFLQRNTRSNIVPLQMAVGNRSENITFWVDGADHENSSLAEASTQKGVPITVPCVTVDAFTASQNITPTIIIMDIQGAELMVFEGMQKTLQDHHPLLFLELWPYGLDRMNASLDNLRKMLKDNGYMLYALGSHLPDAEKDWDKLIQLLRSMKGGRGFCNLIARYDK